MKTNFIFIYTPGRKRSGLGWRDRSVASRLTALVTLAALALFTLASLLSMHVHVVGDGRILVHSHAAPESESPHGHDHSAREYTCLSAMGHTLDSGCESRVFNYSFFPTVFLRSFSAQQLADLDPHLIDDHGRSPPQFVS